MNVSSRYTVITGFWLKFPCRFMRLMKHFFSYKKESGSHFLHTIWIWPLELVLLCFDLLGLPDLWLQIQVLLFREIRLLNQYERKIITDFYGENGFLDEVWMNPRDLFGFKRFALAFVLHNTINYDRTISDGVLIHEFMHVIQYQKVGSPYILRALLAQNSKAGYQYGGPEQLYHNMIRGQSLWSYNYEQQAQIMQDYYKLKSKASGSLPVMELSSYELLLRELKDEILKLPSNCLRWF